MYSYREPSFEEGSKKEWLVSNGLGGYASSTIIGLNTRKYHGLLVAALNPPVDRWLLLSKVEEEFASKGNLYELSTNRYPGTVYPEGYKFQELFVYKFFPTFIYSADGVRVKKTIFTIYGYNATAISYEIEGSGEIRVRPLVNFRPIHSNLHVGELEWHLEIKASKNGVKLKPSFEGAPGVSLASDRAKFFSDGLWYYNMVYDEERKRGYDDREDHYSPGEFRMQVKKKGAFHILAVGGRGFEELKFGPKVEELEKIFDREILRKKKLFFSKRRFLRKLSLAADSFIVKRGKGKSIIAGYHWFDDWGRDAMISLPGLTLVTGRYDDAKEILKTYAKACRNGIIPNRFSEYGGAEYNTADASLWFIYAVYKYLEYTEDFDFVRSLWSTMTEIIESYRFGVGGIRMDDDFLIWSPSQYTWMDAKIDNTAITPREGKAVEVNALWYNALKIMDKIGGKMGDTSDYKTLANNVRKSFNIEFWNERKGCLFDVVGKGWKDPSIRPNQIFAVSLPYTMLNKRRAEKVLEVVERELLTPYGLRTLSPDDPNYRGVYAGDQASRDSAYHQGTVWPWLIGPFITAYVKVKGEKTSKFLKALIEHLSDAGLGTISEVFDGDPPHTPGGCISQAWSVAEVLRCYMEDIGG